MKWLKRSAALIVVLVLIGWTAVSMDRTSRQIRDEEAELLRRRISEAAVLCYALEGSYPEDVSYLEENYGVVIDRSRYHVFYETFGSNMRPDIEVYRRGSGG